MVFVRDIGVINGIVWLEIIQCYMEIGDVDENRDLI